MDVLTRAARCSAGAAWLAAHSPGWVLQIPSTGYPMGGGCWLGFPDGAGRLREADRLGAMPGPGGPGLLAGAWG
ncbi:hypothetical protein AB0I84_26655 [Streptomyces spectabilis]|uniref:hypothetical protein n=1 Tax=Streptomyces spectabilis TaxID=68270 RepID=UPI00340AD329